MPRFDQALEIVEEVLSFGYRQIISPTEFFGEELMEKMITWGSLNSKEFLGENIDYWESVHKKIPEQIRNKYLEVYGEDPYDWE
jgi:hypothetical protein